MLDDTQSAVAQATHVAPGTAAVNIARRFALRISKRKLRPGERADETIALHTSPAVSGEHRSALLDEPKGRLGAHHALLIGGAHVHEHTVEVDCRHCLLSVIATESEAAPFVILMYPLAAVAVENVPLNVTPTAVCSVSTGVMLMVHPGSGEL